VKQRCTIAPSLFFLLCIGFFSVLFIEVWQEQVLEYADDVALLAELLKVLILSLEIMQEASPISLEINWEDKNPDNS